MPADIALIEAVAERALEYSYQVWGFGEGMALLGLARAGIRCHRPQWIDAVADLVSPSLKQAPDPTDHLIPVDVLVELARVRPVSIDDAVARFRTAAVAGPHRPDLFDLGTTIWVDCMHTDGPGLAPAAAALAIKRSAAMLQDHTGLFSHSFDVATRRTNRAHWGRGQGWALHGMRVVPAMLGRQVSLLTALARYETDGAWRTIVDDPDAPIEHSVSALVAAVDGIGPAWAPMRRRALASAVAALDGNGGLPVSGATPARGRDTYLDRETGVFPWGQGPLLLALLSEELAPGGAAELAPGNTEELTS